VEGVASAGVVGEGRPSGILANAAASNVCITSDLSVNRPESKRSWHAQSFLTRPLLAESNSKGWLAPPYLWTFQRRGGSFLWSVQRKEDMTDAKKSEVLQGTLDLMILKTLHALGPQHGFGIARRIEQVSHDVLQLNEGTVYTSLLRLQQQGWITAEWGTSDNNRKAKFYSITARGRKQLAVETENWERISGVMGRVLRLEGDR
jgi:PadR family transcriptional regulator, regulatory protein PadR